jgi:hypothetical protein
VDSVVFDDVIEMNRRNLITLLGVFSALVVEWPFAALTQQRLPVVGFLNSASPGPAAALLAAFHRGLNRTVYLEGESVSVEYRWAEGHYDQLPVLAANLVSRGVAVIAATGGWTERLRRRRRSRLGLRAGVSGRCRDRGPGV